MQVSRQELDKVRSCKSNLNKMLARVLELKQVYRTCSCMLSTRRFILHLDLRYH